MSERARASCFSCGDDVATVTTMARVLKPFAGLLAGASVGIYPSVEMGGTPCMASLQPFAPMLLAMVELDPRGGIYSQCHMEKAIHLTIDACGLLPTMVDAGAEESAMGQHSEASTVNLVAYKFRVMLNAVRHLVDSKSTAPWIVPIAQVIRTAAPSVHAQSRRAARLSTRQHPFPFFRSLPEQDAAEEQEQEQEQEASEVACYFDYSSLRGAVLQSDGPLL